MMQTYTTSDKLNITDDKNTLDINLEKKSFICDTN